MKHADEGTTRHWMVVFGVIFVCSWCGNQFSPLLLLYKQHDHYSALIVNAFLGVYVFGLAPALLLSGALSDRHGRRPVMFAGIVTAVLASVCLSFSAAGPGGIFAGRLLAGITVGTAMAVGNSWLKELSQPPHDRRADTGAGARRASLAFTLGSAAGALVAGLVAQLSPWGEELPFIVHIAITLPFVWLLWKAPETSTSGGEPGPLYAQFRIPAAGHRRFTRVVLVAAPWIFASAALAYGYVPVLLAGVTGKWGLGYATALTVVALGVAALIQPVAKRIDSPSSARGLVVCLGTVAAALVVGALAVQWSSVWLGMLASVVFGAGIGVGLVSGLLEVQRIASPRDLAGLTGVFYAVAYAGFLSPTVLAAVTPPFSTVALFAGLAVLALVCMLMLLRAYRRHLPRPQARAVRITGDGRVRP
ncbi:MFS transporter [Planotetraspora thailandica]|uniref:MFS transporter n=1 Tax=Planotetraspora thailandica TaxID=487172 RepID=A0A8J3VA66_9ACTN|nr:MFS transporter [Planotetraspora thailandica]GII57841.1 MFS transporter [Planotetraspora thailandica]